MRKLPYIAPGRWELDEKTQGVIPADDAARKYLEKTKNELLPLEDYPILYVLFDEGDIVAPHGGYHSTPPYNQIY